MGHAPLVKGYLTLHSKHTAPVKTSQISSFKEDFPQPRILSRYGNDVPNSLTDASRRTFLRTDQVAGLSILFLARKMNLV